MSAHNKTGTGSDEQQQQLACIQSLEQRLHKQSVINADLYQTVKALKYELQVLQSSFELYIDQHRHLTDQQCELRHKFLGESLETRKKHSEIVTNIKSRLHNKMFPSSAHQNTLEIEKFVCNCQANHTPHENNAHRQHDDTITAHQHSTSFEKQERGELNHAGKNVADDTDVTNLPSPSADPPVAAPLTRSASRKKVALAAASTNTTTVGSTQQGAHSATRQGTNNSRTQNSVTSNQEGASNTELNQPGEKGGLTSPLTRSRKVVGALNNAEVTTQRKSTSASKSMKNDIPLRLTDSMTSSQERAFRSAETQSSEADENHVWKQQHTESFVQQHPTQGSTQHDSVNVSKYQSPDSLQLARRHNRDVVQASREDDMLNVPTQGSTQFDDELDHERHPNSEKRKSYHLHTATTPTKKPCMSTPSSRSVKDFFPDTSRDSGTSASKTTARLLALAPKTVTNTAKNTRPVGNLIAQRRFSITGITETSRDHLKVVIARYFGTYKDSVTRKTDVLICGVPLDPKSSIEKNNKYKTAKKYGIEIVSELQFREMVEAASRFEDTQQSNEFDDSQEV